MAPARSLGPVGRDLLRLRRRGRHRAPARGRWGEHLRRSILVLAPLAVLVMWAPAQATGITVNTLADELNTDGDCSLREAIQAANTDTPVDAYLAGLGADIISLSS